MLDQINQMTIKQISAKIILENPSIIAIKELSNKFIASDSDKMRRIGEELSNSIK